MSLYQKHLLMESIRIIEGDSPSSRFNADYNALSIEDALHKRTQLAELRYQVSSLFLHFKQLLNFFLSLLCLFFFVLGVTSVSQFLMGELGSQINFFWGLILFIVPNSISLIFWLFLYIKKTNFTATWVAHVSLSLIALLDKLHHKLTTKNPHYLMLFKFYFKHRFGSKMGRRQLSFISHLGWSAYLLGTMFSLLLVLATHQIDFIWQTTILNENTFIRITQLLTYIPNLFAFDVPNSKDVSDVSIGIKNSLQTAQQVRISWSNLLIFSLMIYALLPRVILMFVFYQRIKRAQQQFSPDLSLPYYVQLKSLLHPIVKANFIKDANTTSLAISEDKLENKHYNHSLVFPVQAYPFAIELSNTNLQYAKCHADKLYSIDLINTLDGKTQNMALSALHESHSNHVLLYVDVMRTPDRGWLSLVGKCYFAKDIQVYLVLLGNKPVDQDSEVLSRLENWVSMAAQAKINTQHITYLLNEKDGGRPNH